MVNRLPVSYYFFKGDLLVLPGKSLIDRMDVRGMRESLLALVQSL